MNGSNTSLVSAIRGPITLITVGVLFALNNFTSYRMNQTWPVLLIVFGLLTILRRSTERVPPVNPAGPPPYNYPPPPPGPAGTYRQTPYQGYTPPPPPPPSGPAKGGFGTSAPPRPAEPGQTPSGESI